MQHWIGPILAIIGVILLVYGFNKNNRKTLAVAGIVLFLAGSAGDFLHGFTDELNKQNASGADHAAAQAGA